MRKLSQIFAWDKWLLKFNFLKYLGLLIMILGPLIIIYQHVFKGYNLIWTITGSILLFVIGLIIWLNGWDPYENVLENNQMYESLKILKGFFEVIEWYKWLLKFNIIKYVALSFMTIGPLFFIYGIIFLAYETQLMFIYMGISFIIGIFLWIISWDPYS